MSRPPCLSENTPPVASGLRTGYSFQMKLVLVFVSLVVASVLLVAFYTYLANRNVTLGVSRELLSQTADTVVAQTVNYLSPAISSTESLTRYLTDRPTILTDQPDENAALESMMRAIMDTSPHPALLYIGDEKGRFLSITRTQLVHPDHYALTDLGEISLRGRDQRIRVYTLTGKAE